MYLCRVADADLAYCRRRLSPANSETVMTPSDVTDYVTAPAAYKRLSPGAVAAIMELCSSGAAGGGSAQPACLDRYLKNFARRITTSGNKFVGR